MLKKSLYVALGLSVLFLLFLVGEARAASVPWDRPAVGRINPLYSQDTVVGNVFTGTSTTATSSFPNASTTNLYVSSLTSGNCVQAATNGLLTTAAAACGAGGTNYWTLTGNNLQNNSGTAVGINTAPTLAALEVMGNGITSATNALTLWNASSSPLFNVGNDGNTIITSPSAGAFTVGGNGATNPAFNIDASTASAATGLNIKSAAAAGGVALSAISSGTNEPLSLDAKGTGVLNLGVNSTGGFAIGGTTGSASSKLSVPSANVIRLMAGTTQVYSGGQASNQFAGIANNTTSARFSVTSSADTGITAGTEATHSYFNLGTTRQHASNTAIALQRDFRVTGSTHAFATTGGVITQAAAFSVDGSDSAGTNATITNSAGIYVPSATVTGTVTNGYGLQVSAPAGATNNYAASTTGRIVLNSISGATSGNVTLCINATSKEIFEGGSGTSCAVSTETAKTDISTSTAGIDELMALRPVTYFFDKGTETQEQIGLLAEEADAVDPRLSQKDPEGNIVSIRWDNIAGLMLKAIQDIWHHDNQQDAQIVQLQAEIDDLKTKCVMK